MPKRETIKLDTDHDARAPDAYRFVRKYAQSGEDFGPRICEFCGERVREANDPRGDAPRLRCNGGGREHTVLDENMRPLSS